MPLYFNAFEGIDFVNDTIKCALYQSDFVEDLTDQFLSDISGTEASGSGYVRKTLASKTATVSTNQVKKYYDAADVSWTGLTEPDLAVLLVFKDTGNAATSRLIGYVEDPDGPRVLVNATAAYQWQSLGLFDVRFL